MEFHPHIYLPQFRLLGYSRSTSRNALTTGNFSRLQLELFFARSVGFYVAQVYIPAALVVIISWLPFWLDRHDHHARVALGVTTVLTMTTLSTNVNAEFPKISYVKAIDVYLFTSFLFVFFSLIEYAIVGYYEFSRSTAPVVLAREVSSSSDEDENDSRDEEEKDGNENKRGAKEETNNRQTENEGGHRRRRKVKRRNDSRRKSKRVSVPLKQVEETTSVIDSTARRLFPLSFVLFNLLYIVGMAVLVSNASYQTEIQVKF